MKKILFIVIMGIFAGCASNQQNFLKANSTSIIENIDVENANFNNIATKTPCKSVNECYKKGLEQENAGNLQNALGYYMNGCMANNSAASCVKAGDVLWDMDNKAYSLAFVRYACTKYQYGLGCEKYGQALAGRYEGVPNNMAEGYKYLKTAMEYYKRDCPARDAVSCEGLKRMKREIGKLEKMSGMPLDEYIKTSITLQSAQEKVDALKDQCSNAVKRGKSDKSCDDTILNLIIAEQNICKIANSWTSSKEKKDLLKMCKDIKKVIKDFNETVQKLKQLR